MMEIVVLVQEIVKLVQVQILLSVTLVIQMLTW